MRKRILILTVLAVLAITGCGSSRPNGKLDKYADEIVLGPDGITVSPTETPTEAPAGESETDTSEKDEKYYLIFEANTVDGEAWNSDRIADSKMTMINVWATYCNPCLEEMPDLGELAAEYDASELQLIGVVSDVMENDSADNINYARELISETKADYPHVLLNESLYQSFVGAVNAVPTTFFVRQDGSLIGYLTGAQSKENWRLIIEQLFLEEQ